MQHLALQVGDADGVAIHHTDSAYASCCQVERDGRTQSAGSYQQHLRLQQLLLGIEAEAIEDDVAIIAPALFTSEFHQCLILNA